MHRICIENKSSTDHFLNRKVKWSIYRHKDEFFEKWIEAPKIFFEARFEAIRYLAMSADNQSALLAPQRRNFTQSGRNSEVK